MKITFLNMAALAVAFTMVSCSSDDGAASGEGNLTLEFDNVYGANNLELDTPENPTSENEILKITGIKYIVSNIVLTKEDGTTLTYPKSESYFITDENDEETSELHLSNIPAGDYKSVTFGIGVDMPQYEEGQAQLTAFATTAQQFGLLSDWNAGFTALQLDGSFTSSTVPAAQSFSIKANRTATQYNYKTVTLTFPEKALVRTDITPEVHIFADASQVLDGTHKVKLGSFVSGGNVVLPDTEIEAITNNISGMFTVNHVHND